MKTPKRTTTKISSVWKQKKSGHLPCLSGATCYRWNSAT